MSRVDLSWRRFILPPIHPEGWRFVAVFAAVTLLMWTVAKPVGVARVEVPFEPVGGMEKSARRRVRVIKGDCLWNIARHLYGSGFAYVTIYQANKKQIKNPDLIYPNQVFVVPAKSGK